MVHERCHKGGNHRVICSDEQGLLTEEETGSDARECCEDYSMSIHSVYGLFILLLQMALRKARIPFEWRRTTTSGDIGAYHS